MEDPQFCPGCGSANPARRPVCKQCGRFLHQEAYADGEQAASFSAPVPTHAAISNPPQPFTYARQPRFQERPRVKIVRPTSNRRKFLAGLLGGAAIVAIGSTSIEPLIQNLRIAFNTKDYPYHLGDDLDPDGFSPDLNLMAMTRLSEEHSPDAKLYVWDYQEQHMTPFSTGYGYGDPTCIWSPGNKSFVFQADGSLDMWDIRTQQKIYSYTGDAYSPFSEIHWSFDGSQFAILSRNDDHGPFTIMNPTQFTPVTTFNVSKWALRFAWSPDQQKIAFLVDNPDSSTWSIQIWNIQTRSMDSEITFQSRYNGLSQYALIWSPDGKHIAAIACKQLRVIQLSETITIYNVNDSGESTIFAWSPNGRYLAVNTWRPDLNLLSSENTFYVWDVVEQRIARSYDNSSNSDFQALAWSRDGKHIIAIGTLYRQENWDWS